MVLTNLHLHGAIPFPKVVIASIKPRKDVVTTPSSQLELTSIPKTLVGFTIYIQG